MLSRAQRRNAKAIIVETCKYGHEQGWDFRRTRQNCRKALMTPRPETGLLNIASANVPESQKYPHDLLSWTSDGLGHDHASMNMYQQQTGYDWTPAGYGREMNQTTMNSPNGWGTPEHLMQIPFQVRAFLRTLGQRYWHGEPADRYVHKVTAGALGEMCQEVQGSAYPGRYTEYAGWSNRFLHYNFRFRRAWHATAKPKHAKKARKK